MLDDEHRSRVACCWVALAFVLLLTGCHSSLKVLPGSQTEGGVPFFLAKQEFLITELGVAESGLPATTKPLRITLVTRADSERMYLVNNAPALLSTSQFAIVRDEDGRLTSITGKAEEKVTETVKALAALAVKAVSIARIRETELQDELDAQFELRKKLIDELKKLANAKAIDQDAIQHVEENLTRVQERIDLLEARLAALAQGKASVGVNPSRTIVPAEVILVTSAADAASKAKNLNDGEVGIYLLPVK
jgi:hypothetical protein